ncbi:MAG: O-antigen ligase family protein [Verrucomicrobiota bacterium]
METKDLIGLTLMITVVPAAVLVCCLSRRAQEAAFFLLTAGTVITEKADINFFTHYWYRGTTRGVEFSFVDVLAIAVLVSSLLVPRPGQKRWYWPASLGFLLFYFAYACFSVVISDPKVFGLFELSKMFRGILVFLAAAWFVRGERELAIFVFALACAVCFEGALALKQRAFDGVYRVTGSLDHPNSLSIYLCMAGPILVAASASNLSPYLRWCCTAAIAVAAVAIMLTISRAGIPAFALVTLGATAFCVSWRITLKKVAVAAFVFLAACGLVAKTWDTIKGRFAQGNFEQEFLEDHAEGRGMYVRQAHAIVEERFLGVGLNNWSYWVSKTYGAKLGLLYEDYDDLDYVPSKEILASFHYAAPAHNLGALTVGELGVPGLLIFALLWMRWFQMGFVFLWKRSTEAVHQLGIGFYFATCGVFLQSLTEWVYRQTQIMFAFHLVLGAMASLYYLRRRARRERPLSTESIQEEYMSREPVLAGGS